MDITVVFYVFVMTFSLVFASPVTEKQFQNVTNFTDTPKDNSSAIYIEDKSTLNTLPPITLSEETDEESPLPPPFSSSSSTLTPTLTSSPPTTPQSPSTNQKPVPTFTPIPTTPSNPHPNCPDLSEGDSLSQIAFLDRLTHPCRYDRLTRPGGDSRGTIFNPEKGKGAPVDVYVQLDIGHVEAAENLQFKMHMLLQYRYKDERLSYAEFSPGRARLVGEERLRELIWIPHVLLENERESAIMGHDSRDIYLAIEPNGEVTYSRRIKATFYCFMDLQKFPFDEQICDISLISWTYNASELMLQWEDDEPVVIADQLHLTEYSLKGFWTKERIKQGQRQNRGTFSGNYSSLTFSFRMAREMGFYMLDYFVPSIMLVCISWVSFWLQADASAPRITIGTSTMLSFITLATAQSRTLPKVSYIKASEIWFLACTCFIFGSMVEFAFVNIIWRRKSNVELKKVNSKNILRCTLTPRLHRKELMKDVGAGALQKSHSCSSLDNNSIGSSKIQPYNNYLTVHSFSPGMSSLPRITTESVDDLIEKAPQPSDSISLTVPEGNGSTNPIPTTPHQRFTTMTPQEIAQWIDKRSRLVFPCAFIVFNAFYWGFVYWL